MQFRVRAYPEGITEITGKGPVFEDKQYELDVLIYATGFEVQKTGIYNQIKGEQGLALNDKYRDGKPLRVMPVHRAHGTLARAPGSPAPRVEAPMHQGAQNVRTPLAVATLRFPWFHLHESGVVVLCFKRRDGLHCSREHWRPRGPRT